MEIKLTLNGRPLIASIDADTLLIDFVRSHGCYSSSAAARPQTAACAPCCWTARLCCRAACSPRVRRDTMCRPSRDCRRKPQTLPDLSQTRARNSAASAIRAFVMNTIALLRENPDPTDDEIRAYLAGNLCRCSGYEGQLRGIRAYLDSRKGAEA